jgi:hypothetical protein
MTALATDDLITRLIPLAMEDNGFLRYPELAELITYAINGVRHVGATDGSVVVFMTSDLDVPVSPVNFYPIFASYTPGAGNTFTVKAAALLEFASVPVKPWECDCPDCCTVHEPRQTPGLFGHVLCDLVLLSRGLQAVTLGETCELVLPDDYPAAESGKPIFLRGDDWWVVLMPLKLFADGETPADLPRFEVTR